MKFFIPFTIFFLVLTCASHAQQTRVGIRGGLNLAKLNFDQDISTENLEHKFLPKYFLTVFLDYAPVNSFSFQPGLSFTGKGTKFTNTYDKGRYSNLSLLYFELPINAVGKIPLSFGKIYLGGGPFGAVAVAAQNNLSEGKLRVKLGNDSSSDVKQVDYGINFIGGIELKNGFIVHAGYDLGLANLETDANREIGAGKTSTRGLSFGVGYLF